MQLSENFHLSEFTKSQAASRLGIDNTPGPREIRNLIVLCEKVLEPTRSHYGRPLIASSGYRSPRVNKAIGGSSTSQHVLGEAVDFEIPGVANPDVARWMARSLNYDQLILEFYTPGDLNSGWVHVSYRVGRLRNQELTAARVRGPLGRMKTVYSPGIIA